MRHLLYKTILCSLVFVTLAAAAPKLRLSATTVGPVSIAQGQNGAIQTVDAGNFGDGSLALSVTANVTWISPNIGISHACLLNGTCLPVNLQLITSALAKGTYTGIVTVSDPNAVDAPQTIVVTVQIGGGVPDKLELYLPPDGRNVSQTFVTNSRLTTNVAPPAGPKLSVAMAAAGSYDFSFSYTVQASAAAGSAEQDYTGSINTSGSTFAPDNKSVPVTLHVTSKPIALPSPATLSIRVAQGAAKVDKWLFLVNAGLGSLNLSAVAATTTSGTWLTAVITNGIVVATADPTGLSPGSYAGKLALTTNAVNTVSVDVQLEVLPARGPTVLVGGVIDNAAGEGNLALGGIISIYGEQLTTGAPTKAPSLPLGTTLGGATVFLNDKPIYAYSIDGSSVVNPTGQVNAVIPFDAQVGDGVLRVDRDGQRGNSVAVKISRSAPRFLKLGIGNYGIIVNSDGTYPIPATPGIPSHPAKGGDALTIYGLGFGPTDPPASSNDGAPAQEPLARVAGGFRVYFGGSGIALSPPVEPLYVGLTPLFLGLYQVNVVVPNNAPRGVDVPVYVSNDLIISNRVSVAIE